METNILVRLFPSQRIVKNYIGKAGMKLPLRTTSCRPPAASVVISLASSGSKVLSMSHTEDQ